ncbi:hypothetical protein [Teredinibacter franksiae]|uniref:hypothetical protein n=1 Tax=Teredinibacter franksiae TaxID=2761453 RepID=UPI001627736A|nr:hypothetical protein [Teredinibacter franksiae]
MKIRAILPTFILLALSNSGCAKEAEQAAKPHNPPPVTESPDKLTPVNKSTKVIHQIKAEIIDNRALYIVDEAVKGIASLHYTKPVSADVLANWVLHILRNQGTSDVFIQKLAPRLKMNPRLNTDAFTLPIMDLHGKKHIFKLSGNPELRFFTLQYHSSESGE